jgi:hypothetical protein
MDAQRITSGRRQRVPVFALAIGVILAVAITVLAIQATSLMSTTWVQDPGRTTIGSSRFAIPHTVAGGRSVRDGSHQTHGRGSR